jgi:hypothetical protein
VVVSGSRWTVGIDVVVDSDRRAREVRGALEWAQVRALATDGVSQREIAARLGIDRRTVRRLVCADESPRYGKRRANANVRELSRPSGRIAVVPSGPTGATKGSVGHGEDVDEGRPV